MKLKTSFMNSLIVFFILVICFFTVRKYRKISEDELNELNEEEKCKHKPRS